MARRFSTDLGVVKDGQLIETGNTDAIIHNPQQKYTKELIDIFDD
ncbi:hypothetical protein [Candidatus Enterococcus testudinis]|nr:hypothetical protein [Enterococcus sp. 8G7_MSG3316]